MKVIEHLSVVATRRSAATLSEADRSLLDRLHITRAYHIVGNHGQALRGRNPELAEGWECKD